MSCKCHGKMGVPVKGTVKPDDQCLVCAAKHLEMAVVAWGEFTYEESNRRWVAGHVRLAVEHTRMDHRDYALALRDVAVAIEMHEDKSNTDIRDRLLDMQDLCLKMLHEQKPEIEQRLTALKNDVKTDIIIPLGNGSTHGNDELRYLLRSMEKNLKGYDRVFLVTQCCPDWIQNVTVVDIPDKYSHNKDANLHLKTLETVRMHDVKRFVWLSDDNAFLRPIHVSDIPVIHNHRPNAYFYGEDATKWRNRVRNTLEWAKSRGIDLPHTYECHCPQVFDGVALLEGMKDVDYVSEPGLTIFTAWRAVTDSWHDSKSQPDYKWTFELPMDETPLTMSEAELTSKPFLGYNEGASGKVLERLKKMFLEKSRFEK